MLVRNFLQKKKRSGSSRPKPQVELGTQNNKSDVDYEWLPKQTLKEFSKIYNKDFNTKPFQNAVRYSNNFINKLCCSQQYPFFRSSRCSVRWLLIYLSTSGNLNKGRCLLKIGCGQ